VGTAESVRILAGSPFWAQAEVLRILRGAGWNEPIPFGEEEAPAEAEPSSLDPLFDSPGSRNLRELDFSGYGLRDAGVARLCAAAWAGTLTYLDLSRNYLTDEALRELARSGRFKSLRTLHLNFNSVYHQPGAGAHESITDAGLRVLAECPDLTNLRVLTLSGTRITAAGVDAVLNAPHWRLTGLHLAECQLRPAVIEVLASSPRTARLEVLDLSSNDEIGGGDLTHLAESEYLSPLTELDVRGIAGGESVRGELRRRLGRRLSE
jgi:Ran GTPase-activating protein (RanGAP) involved in mRNA processing and transport